MAAPFSPRRSSFSSRPAVEALEDRLAPATFTVVNHDNDGDGSLRWAITRANAVAGADVIVFNIPGGGIHTIDLLSALPAITGPTAIKGQTQPGFDGVPLIELNGAGAGAGAHGLGINPGAAGSVVRGLIINRFGGDGISVAADNCRIVGCYIGTDSNGNADSGNTGNGVVLFGGAAGNVVGGTTAVTRNVISGNDENGVLITDSGTTANVVLGNSIGTDVTGSLDRGNSFEGVKIQSGAGGNVIGGAVAGARNLISGNDDTGIFITGSGTSANLVQGNFIGTSSAGDTGVPNSAAGVFLADGAAGNLVGGTTAGSRNVISGNGGNGVGISGAATTGNRVKGNRIGTDRTGTLELGNLNGVRIDTGANNNVIGGVVAGARNIISGNRDHGMLITGAGTTANRVLGNFIGTNRTGSAAIGNALNGVSIVSGATGNVIGGTVAGSRNVISGNNAGVSISSVGTSGNAVQGNFIGTDAAGTGDLGNAFHGVQIASGATNNVVGGTVVGAGNVISGNNNTGVVFSGAGTTGNLLRGNRIGVAASSGSALANAFTGVLITGGASGNEVGGTAAGSGNVIARNGTTGVRIEPGAGNKVLRNSIFANGQLGIDIGPAGVTLNNPADGLLNFPDLDVARLTASGLRVRGSINTEADATVRIEFFVSPAADSSGHGEGKRFLGAISVQTQAGIDVEFSTLIASSGVQLGQFITATATDELGNTSEFSLALAVS
jgi:hypothetical protein